MMSSGLAGAVDTARARPQATHVTLSAFQSEEEQEDYLQGLARDSNSLPGSKLRTMPTKGECQLSVASKSRDALFTLSQLDADMADMADTSEAVDPQTSTEHHWNALVPEPQGAERESGPTDDTANPQESQEAPEQRERQDPRDSQQLDERPAGEETLSLPAVFVVSGSEIGSSVTRQAVPGQNERSGQEDTNLAPAPPLSIYQDSAGLVAPHVNPKLGPRIEEVVSSFSTIPKLPLLITQPEEKGDGSVEHLESSTVGSLVAKDRPSLEAEAAQAERLRFNKENSIIRPEIWGLLEQNRPDASPGGTEAAGATEAARSASTQGQEHSLPSLYSAPAFGAKKFNVSRLLESMSENPGAQSATSQSLHSSGVGRTTGGTAPEVGRRPRLHVSSLGKSVRDARGVTGSEILRSSRGGESIAAKSAQSGV